MINKKASTPSQGLLLSVKCWQGQLYRAKDQSESNPSTLRSLAEGDINILEYSGPLPFDRSTILCFRINDKCLEPSFSIRGKSDQGFYGTGVVFPESGGEVSSPSDVEQRSHVLAIDEGLWATIIVVDPDIVHGQSTGGEGLKGNSENVGRARYLTVRDHFIGRQKDAFLQGAGARLRVRVPFYFSPVTELKGFFQAIDGGGEGTFGQG